MNALFYTNDGIDFFCILCFEIARIDSRETPLVIKVRYVGVGGAFN